MNHAPIILGSSASINTYCWPLQYLKNYHIVSSILYPIYNCQYFNVLSAAGILERIYCYEDDLKVLETYIGDRQYEALCASSTSANIWADCGSPQYCREITTVNLLWTILKYLWDLDRRWYCELCCASPMAADVWAYCHPPEHYVNLPLYAILNDIEGFSLLE